MEAIKSFTSLEQSRKLAKILPLESADMTYRAITGGTRDKMSIRGWEVHVGLAFAIKEKLFSYRDGYMVPCWSLAVLLNLIPDSIYENTDNFAQLEITKRSLGYHDINDNIVIGTLAGNLVDACYEMIIKLHEQNLLQL